MNERLVADSLGLKELDLRGGEVGLPHKEVVLSRLVL